MWRQIKDIKKIKSSGCTCWRYILHHCAFLKSGMWIKLSVFYVYQEVLCYWPPKKADCSAFVRKGRLRVKERWIVYRSVRIFCYAGLKLTTNFCYLAVSCVWVWLITAGMGSLKTVFDLKDSSRTENHRRLAGLKEWRKAEPACIPGPRFTKDLKIYLKIVLSSS